MSDDSIDEVILDERVTQKDYQNIPTDIVPPYLKRSLWKHQYQGIYSALKAEADAPEQNEKGELFYSRFGILALGTGTGKTAIALGIANFDVGDPCIQDDIIQTSLSTVLLKRKVRPNIDVSIICTQASIINTAWVRDGIQRFYPDLPHYIFPTVGVFEKSIEQSKEMYSLTLEINNLIQYVASVIAEYEQRRMDQQQFENYLSAYENSTIDSLFKAHEFLTKLNNQKEKVSENLITRKLIELLQSVKVFFVTKDSFYFLFRVFEKYTVSRILIDEPQNTVLTKQLHFKDYIPNERVKHLKSIGMAKTTDKIYYEESPCRFLWYISATPHQIDDNSSDHYFNKWVSRNEYIINDYVYRDEKDRLFPLLVEKYVIKFPFSYIISNARPDLPGLITRYNLKIRGNLQGVMLRGLLGEEIDEMIQNDDYEAIINKLSIDGSVGNVLDLAVNRLRIDVGKLEYKISNYDPKTGAHIREESNRKLEEAKKNLLDLQKKIARFRGKDFDDECPICYNTMHIRQHNGETAEQRCVIHLPCMNGFHMGCIKNVMASQNPTCPMCREDIKIEDFKPSYDEGRILENQTESTNNKQLSAIDMNISYENKIEALKASLGPMVRNNQYVHRMKVLLFVQLDNDSSKLEDIIRICQQMGFNIRLPFNVGTKPVLAQKYPDINGCSVRNPKAKSSLQKEMDDFRNKNERTVWIFRSSKESAGLNFPFVDTIIKYSKFKSEKQIDGRGIRLDRREVLDIIRLDFDNVEDDG